MIKRLLPVMLGLVVLLTTGGVYATWTYSNGGTEPVFHLFDPDLGILTILRKRSSPEAPRKRRKSAKTTCR